MKTQPPSLDGLFPTAKRAHILKALLFREWILMRTWLLSFLMVVLAGPVINVLNAIGASSSVRLTSLLASVYIKFPIWPVDVKNHHIVFVISSQLDVPVVIYGYPIASLWVIGVSILLGALLANFDRQTSPITDTFNTPVRRTQWLTAKLLLGGMSLFIIIILRTLVLLISNSLSPLHVSLSTLGLSGADNLIVALAAFAVSFFVGILVNNFILAAGLGFLGLMLPLAIGAFIEFLSFVPFLSNWVRDLRNMQIPRLSPFSYTNYGSSANLSFPPSTIAYPTPNHLSMTTAIHHPWQLGVGTSIICVVGYLCSMYVMRKVNIEQFDDLFISAKALRTFLIFGSFEFGVLAALICGRHFAIVSLALGLLCYGVLWGTYRRLALIGITDGTRQRARSF